MLYDGIEIYNAVIADDEDGITYISLVDLPAVERDFVCFSKPENLVRFAVENEEKRIISGVIMLANTPIYRRHGDYEYFLIYSPETIQKMAQKMLSDGTFKNVDLMHDNQVVNGVKLTELYIKDEKKGIVPNFVSDVPDGSLMGSFHVEDEALWNTIKNGDVLKGFSLEGLFTVEKMQNNKQTNKEKKMSKITKFIKSLMKFGEVSTDKGTLYFGEDEIAVGVEVFVNGENEEEKVAAEDGEYVLEDERTVVVAEGKVVEIKEKEEEPAEEPKEETEVVVENEEEVPEAEVVVEEPKADERDVNAERIEALEQKVADLETAIADLAERLSKIEMSPAVEPIVEEFEKAHEINTNGLPKEAQKALKLFKNRK